MKIALHIHHHSQIKAFRDSQVDFVITEPLFSYKHPHVTDKAAFLSLLEACLETNQKTYVEINGFIEEGDLEGLKTWIKELLNYPISGFYFADLAVYMMLKEAGYPGETIYAPETILTNTLEVKTLLKSVDRVMISKELTLAEILTISETFPNQIEIFGAGHLLMSVSRRPLLSNYLSHIGQIENVINKVDYRIRELKRKENMPIMEEDRTFCVFTQDIQNPLEELPQLIQANIFGIHLDSLFIEEKEAELFFNQILSQNNSFDETKLRDFYLDHSDLPLFKGYFYRKTNLSKESV